MRLLVLPLLLAGCLPGGRHDEDRLRFVDVAAGIGFTCAFDEHGEMYCFGDNAPTDLPSDPVVQIDAVYHVCARTIFDEVLCWCRRPGGCEYGEADVPPGRFSRVSVGSFHTCVLDLDGYPLCWGLDTGVWFDYGQVSQTPEMRLEEIAAGPSYTCALDLDRELFCWGSDDIAVRSLGRGPFAVLVGTGINACTIDDQRQLDCWGISFDDPDDPDSTPVPPGRFVDVCTGHYDTCAVHEEGDISCFGETHVIDETHHLDEMYHFDPPPRSRFVRVACSGSQVCAIDLAGSLHCWGHNDSGEADPSVLDP